jgi:hypothetical protein
VYPNVLFSIIPIDPTIIPISLCEQSEDGRLICSVPGCDRYIDMRARTGHSVDSAGHRGIRTMRAGNSAVVLLTTRLFPIAIPHPRCGMLL